METMVRVPKTEYQRLRKIAEHFEMVRWLLTIDFFAEPPVRDVGQIIKGFKKTGKYNQIFLKSLELGLKESEYFSSTRTQ